jgi:hypothetical protein
LVVVILPSKWVGWLVVACMRVVDDARHVMPALASLNVKCADLGAAGVAALASALGGRTALASLDLGFNDLGAAGAAALASALGGRLAALASLGLSGAGLGAAGVAALAPALWERTALASLDLGNNRLGAAGAAALAPGLGGGGADRALHVRQPGTDDVQPRPSHLISSEQATQCGLSVYSSCV